MSSNRASTSKPDPRIAKREVMVTRHKSAQMKRQLRTKDRSMKHVTDLLKSPTKESQTATKNIPAKKKQISPKAKHSLLKSVEKVQNLPQKTFRLSKVLRKEVILIPDEEYHPNKLKRKLNVRKVMLKPKNALKVVGEIVGSVKRKCAIPSKAADAPDQPEPPPVRQPASPLSKLSMSEAMRMMEEQLTDEDMMEILTCPSPVWWEDPPDENYVEDALFTRSSSIVKASTPEPTQMDVDSENNGNDVDKIILIPNLSEKSDKFLKKRSKLEDLLGNIKNKSNKDTDNYKCSNDNDNNEIDVNEVINEKRKARLSESDDEIMFHNSSMNEDELLKDLENMDIPIANSLSDVIVIDDDDDFLEKTNDANACKESKVNDEPTTETVNEDKRTETVNEDKNPEAVIEDKSNDQNEDKNTDTVPNEVPKNLPALQKCELLKVISSPRSLDSLSSKSSVVSSQDIDSISDTNIRFLLEDDVEDNKDIQACNDKMAAKSDDIVNESCTEAINDKIAAKNDINTEASSETAMKSNETSNESASKESDKHASDNLTVYKIIDETNESNEVTNNEITKDVKEDDTSSNLKMNDYYKKCKKIQKRVKNEKTDINKNVTETDIDVDKAMYCDSCKPSFKRVSDDENVKYCLNCSSIFDTKECNYCIRKSKNRTYTCCKIKFCCETLYKTHKCEQKSCRDEICKINDFSDSNSRSSYSVS